MVFTGERSVFPEFSATLSLYDTGTNTIYREIPVIFGDETIEINYTVSVIQTGTMINLVDVQTGNTVEEEMVPFTTTGDCEIGHNPLNDGDFAVSGSNNADCVQITVVEEAIHGQCGSFSGQSFYAPSEPI